jgi:hypothetical protein
LIFEFCFVERRSLLISHEKYIKEGKVLDHLGLRCGLEVQKPTQALKSVKGPGNTFD